MNTIQHSESYNNVLKAVGVASSLLSPVEKGARNAFKNYDYAKLSNVQEALSEPLKEADLTIMQHPTLEILPIGETGNTLNVVNVTTYIVHGKTAEWLSFSTLLPVEKLDAQAVGSAITYARRYGLLSIFNMETEDDDGVAAIGGYNNNAQKRPPKQVKPVPPKKNLTVAQLKKEVSTLAPKLLGDNYKEAEFSKWASEKVGEEAVESIGQLSKQALEAALVSLEARASK